MRHHPTSLASDRVAYGIHLSLLCPEVVEFCGHLGFEWLLLDAEHTPLNHHLGRELMRAADVVGLPCLVRVPEISASVIEGFLDAGAIGIIAPNVSSAAQARELVAAVKFPPEGKRGAAARSRAAGYGLLHSPIEYVRQANRATMVAALIETRPGIDALESILAVPGLDYIGIGTSDLALSLGIDAGMDDPQLRTMVDGAQVRIRRYGKPQIAVATDANGAQKAAAAGAKLIAVPDTALLAAGASSFLQQATHPG